MMNILLTNDDGINAAGLWAMQKVLTKIGRVFIVAPDSERSSIGHAITLAQPIFAKKISVKRLFAYAVSGSPADCVKLGVSELLPKKPDIVVSGINLGPNDGCSIFYSGTVAGAREAALMGIPAMAISLGTFFRPNFRYAANLGVKIVRFIHKNPLPKGTFLNVNVPPVPKSKIKGVRLCRQGRVPIHGFFEKRKDPFQREYYWMKGKMAGVEKDINTDTYALERNYVTVVPIRCDATDYDFLEAVQEKPI